ncbi:DUF1648 domain-containing protein [Caryophanon latum]|uniref:DUF1648 domain-containing protein n=1 Tax=Caryophanon latum TaxID=33977 RepID=A0A1C0YU88_9BACL|nr:DUF1648 domain-containing protein [Caryophanon latum]OCS90712.1 hypothetical protein A6K76_01280 [Caryophanon latum]
MQKNIEFTLHKTWWRHAFDLIGLSSVALAIVYTLIHWSQLPEAVPIHFKAIGQTESYGSRYALFLIPTIAAALYAFFHNIEKRPYLHNYFALTDRIAPTLYKTRSLLAHIVKNLTMLLLSYAMVSLVESAMHGTSSLNMWVFGSLLGFVLLPAVIGYVYSVLLQLNVLQR